MTNDEVSTPTAPRKREKLILVVLIIVIAAAVGLYFAFPRTPIMQTASTETDNTVIKVEVPTISAVDLKSLLDSSAPLILIDVRRQTEYAEEHVAGAANIPVADLEDFKKYLPPDVDLITMCDGSQCQRSQAAAEKLIEWGFKHVRCFTGGTKEWKEEAYPIVIGVRSEVKYFKIPTIAPMDLNVQMKTSAVPAILDVRNPFDYQQGHIPTARNTSFADVESLVQNQTIALDQLVVVYGGANGVKTETAARTLLANGAKDVAILDGSYEAWGAGNYPISKENNK